MTRIAFGCDRFSDVVTDANMTLQQVSLFVEESLDLRWQWDRIRLLGGEPTLHPQFLQMVETVKHYRKEYPKCFLQVLSNGMGKLGQYRDQLIDWGVDPHVEPKEKGVTPAWFWNTRQVAVDRDPNVGALEPCGIYGVHGCGIGLTRWGYFLDGAGASAARVAGIDCGILHLRDVTEEAMLDQAKLLCRICGQWNPTDGSSPVTQLVSDTGKVAGKFWTERIAAFKASKPKMQVYGEDK